MFATALWYIVEEYRRERRWGWCSFLTLDLVALMLVVGVVPPATRAAIGSCRSQSSLFQRNMDSLSSVHAFLTQNVLSKEGQSEQNLWTWFDKCEVKFVSWIAWKLNQTLTLSNAEHSKIVFRLSQIKAGISKGSCPRCEIRMSFLLMRAKSTHNESKCQSFFYILTLYISLALLPNFHHQYGGLSPAKFEAIDGFSPLSSFFLWPVNYKDLN
jgi:hypothetical protein